MKKYIAIAMIIVAAVLFSGCGSKHTVSRPTKVLIFIDKSYSICDYPGGLTTMQKDCNKLAQEFLMPILGERNGVTVEARAFVKEDIILFSKKVDLWESIRDSVARELSKPPYPKSEVKKTLFSDLLIKVAAWCHNEPGTDFYVLVLTDGHPDESFSRISGTASIFKGIKVTNLKAMLVGPVQPDMTNRWREKLTESLGYADQNIFVTNETDYQNCIETEKNALGVQ